MKFALDLLLDAIEDGAMPGATVCIYHHGEVMAHEAFGTTDGHQATRCGILYDLASLTKPIATASTVTALVERGYLLLNAPVAEFVPGAPATITVRHLLTHTSGLPAWAPCYRNGGGLDAAVAAILALDAAPPETKYEYSCLGYILLAQIVEVVVGATLDTAARRFVFDPLRLENLTFRPDPTIEVAPTRSQEGPEGKSLRLDGVVHDGNARAIEAVGTSVSGNAGLFGTAADVARFGEAIRTGGLFGAPTRARWLTNQASPAGHTLAFFCPPNPLTPAGELLPTTAVGHSGYTGTALLIDPAHELTVAVLTNAVFGDGKDDWLTTRRRFFNAIAASL